MLVKGVKVSDDGMKARIIVDELRRYYIHTITLDGVIDQQSSNSLVHPVAYYTLNNIPEGQKLAMSEVSTTNTAPKPATTETKTTTKNTATTGTTAKTGAATTYTFAQIKPLLTKYTCIACHNPEKKQVGPAYVEVAKRNYSVAKILSLIKNPQPLNWPGYSTPMPPMPQVPKGDATKIAIWINSLKGGVK